MPPEPVRSETSSPEAPTVFVVASDPDYRDVVLRQCTDVPPIQAEYRSIETFASALASMEKLRVAFTLIVEEAAALVDVLALRECRLGFPQLNYLMLLGECEQRSVLRFQSIGVQSILLPPFSDVSIAREIATTIPNASRFKRHPDLVKRGSMRMDFVIPSDLSYVMGINHFISNSLREFGFPPPDCRINVPLALDEAITNAIIHGNGFDPTKRVAVRIYVSASRVKVRVSDEGKGFKIGAIENPTRGNNVLRPSGRGIFLMQGIMDTVEFKEGGRVVEMEKRNDGKGRAQ